MWHASVSIRGQNGPKPVVSWSFAEVADAQAVLQKLLRDVGRPHHERHETGVSVLHVRRLTTPDEERMVGGAIDTRKTMTKEELEKHEQTMERIDRWDRRRRR